MSRKLLAHTQTSPLSPAEDTVLHGVDFILAGLVGKFKVEQETTLRVESSSFAAVNHLFLNVRHLWANVAQERIKQHFCGHQNTN